MYNWAKSDVKWDSNVHEMAKHNYNNSYWVKDGIHVAVHEMAQIQGKQFSTLSNESASDEKA